MITLHEVKANGKIVYRGPNHLIALQTKLEHEKKGETVEIESDIPYTGQPIGEELRETILHRHRPEQTGGRLSGPA